MGWKEVMAYYLSVGYQALAVTTVMIFSIVLLDKYFSLQLVPFHRSRKPHEKQE